MKKGDKIIGILILCLVLISTISVFAYMKFIKSDHHIAEIKQNGETIRTIDLDDVESSQEFKIYDGNGNYNIVSVEKGRIRITDSDCPDKICVKTGWINEPGQSIVCLPHKLIIKINGGKKTIDSNVY